ncbi:MAG: leucine-rich repeat domain-containing protein, partial [Clostridia bacterium]|nr:leucine-rich repeat domain-containing protein [Clostridia bacterium]
SDEALVDGNICLEKKTPIKIYVDGTLSKTIKATVDSYTLNEADMPLDYEHCCGYFYDEILMTTIKNDTIDLTSAGQEITFAPRTATASSDGINIYTRTANPESDFSFTYDSSTQTYKIGLSNSDVEGIVVLPKEYDNVQTSIYADYMSYFEFNNEVNLCLQSGVLTIPEYAFGYVDNLKSITIPDSVTSIEDSAFTWCSGLTSVTIPDSVTTIGESAFYYCSGVTGSLTIPDSVTSIGERAFYFFSGLTEVKVTSGNTTYEDKGKNAIIEKRTNTIIQGFDCTDLSVLEGVASIGNYAFSDCRGLTGNLTIPDSITSIGNSAFFYCTGLTGSLIISDSVTSIGKEAFYYCEGLTSVYIPSTVTTISASSYYYAPFNGCSSSLVIYTDVANASSVPSGWGTYWNYRSSSATYTTNYGYTLEQYKSAVGLTFVPNGEKVSGAEVEVLKEGKAYQVDNSYLQDVIFEKKEYILLPKKLQIA